jgi:hypothetical protein
MVLWWDLACLWRKRQQTDGLEPLKRGAAFGEILWAYSCCESYRLEPSSKWSFSFWGRHSWQVHQILEHSHALACKLHRHRVLGLQSDVFQERQRDCEYSRLLTESDHSLEVPYHAKSGDLDRPYLQSFIPFYESRRVVHRNRCRRWNIAVLERFPLC